MSRQKLNKVTSVPLSASDNVPTGLTPTAITGSGWNCDPIVQGVSSLSCTRSSVLSAGTSYPPITVRVNVANPAPSFVTNTATVSGGGESNTSNDTATDPTMILRK